MNLLPEVTKMMLSFLEHVAICMSKEDPQTKPFRKKIGYNPCPLDKYADQYGNLQCHQWSLALLIG